MSPVKRNAQTLFAIGVMLFAAWLLRSFLGALAWACVIALASWPLFQRTRAAMPAAWVAPPLFTVVIGAIFLVPVAYTLAVVTIDLQHLARGLLEAQRNGLPAPQWLDRVPVLGPWLVSQWLTVFGMPGGLMDWLHHLDPGRIVGWVRTFGLDMMHRFLVLAITFITLYFLYHDGEFLAREVRIVARRALGDHGERYLDRVTQTVRATVNGLVLVALGEGLLIGGGYALANVPSPTLWGAVTAVFAMVPFVAPVVFIGISLYLLGHGLPAPALLTFLWGSLVLFVADHFVRPVLIGEAAKLPFLWVLLGILGGVQTFGLLGVFLGPVTMAFALGLWREWTTEVMGQ